MRDLILIGTVVFGIGSVALAECLENVGQCHVTGAKVVVLQPNAPFSHIAYESRAAFASRFRQTWRHTEYKDSSFRTWDKVVHVYPDGSYRYRWEWSYRWSSEPATVYWTTTKRGYRHEVDMQDRTPEKARAAVLRACEAERDLTTDFYGLCCADCP